MYELPMSLERSLPSPFITKDNRFEKYKEIPFPMWVHELLGKANKVFLTGSRFICSPPVLDTDTDILLLVDNIIDFRNSYLENWSICGAEYEGDVMGIYRLNDLNLLVVEDIHYFNRWVMATEIATMLNILDKETRKKLFIAITENPNYIYHI